MFDITKIMAKYKLSHEETAEVLFPNVRFKKQAFDRVINFESSIDVNQLLRLADYLCVNASEFFVLDTFEYTRVDNNITLVRGQYKVVLFADGFYYSIYHDGKLIDRPVSNFANMRLEEFIPYINKQINKHANGSKS